MWLARDAGGIVAVWQASQNLIPVTSIKNTEEVWCIEAGSLGSFPNSIPQMAAIEGRLWTECEKRIFCALPAGRRREDVRQKAAHNRMKLVAITNQQASAEAQQLAFQNSPFEEGHVGFAA